MKELDQNTSFRSSFRSWLRQSLAAYIHS